MKRVIIHATSQSSPILRDILHWLPAQHQISYKIAILARDYIHGIGLFRWRLHPVDCSPWMNYHAFRRVAIFWSLEHEQNWANGTSLYPDRRCGTHSRIRSNILLQAANISEKNWKHTCLRKPTHQPLRIIEEWTYLPTYLLNHSHLRDRCIVGRTGRIISVRLRLV